MLLGRGKGKGKGCRKGRGKGRAAQSENSALRRRLSFNGVDSDQASPMGSQQVHQGDSAAPATPKIDNDDANMEIDPPNVDPVPSPADVEMPMQFSGDVAAAASDDVSVVCCSQLGSLDLLTAESEPAAVVPAVASENADAMLLCLNLLLHRSPSQMLPVRLLLLSPLHQHEGQTFTEPLMNSI